MITRPLSVRDFCPLLSLIFKKDGIFVPYNLLSAMTDADLAALAKQDDQEAFACLLGRYTGMIHAKASSKCEICGIDSIDDLTQDAAIGFLNAVRHYDASKGASFRTFAERCVENVLVSEVRHYLSSKNAPLNHHRQLDDPEISQEILLSAASVDPEGVLLDDEAHSAVLDGLSEFERSVVELRLDGMSYEDAAKKLGVSVKSIDNAIQRVRQKFKSAKKV
jgi:RNA polymerase sigma factor, sigma-70 family